MGFRTIIDSADVNGIYFSTILTSAGILRSSPELDAIPNDIKVSIYTHTYSALLCGDVDAINEYLFVL
ncbi:hypothetical protein LguiB_020866 [Lonicera macranthoides]